MGALPFLNPDSHGCTGPSSGTDSSGGGVTAVAAGRSVRSESLFPLIGSEVYRAKRQRDEGHGAGGSDFLSPENTLHSHRAEHAWE